MTGSNRASAADGERGHVVRRLTVSILVLLVLGVGIGSVVGLLLVRAVDWATGL